MNTKTMNSPLTVELWTQGRNRVALVIRKERGTFTVITNGKRRTVQSLAHIGRVRWMLVRDGYEPETEGGG